MTIHAVMLAALGFLSAILLGLLIAPAYRKRTQRLTTEALKRSMPLTEAEIRADKDRLRADFALIIHELESKVERAQLAAARQRVEINRRDAAISSLEGDVATMRTSLEEHENARRVLEHTIMDRLPKVEHRLSEARRLLLQRDREISKLTASAEKQAIALEEAAQINTQNRDEIHRLSAALTTRASRGRDGLSDGRFDGEVALRSEIESLRAKTRDQAAMVARLQGLLARAGGSVGAKGAASLSPDAAATPLGMHRAEDEIARLSADLAEAEAQLRSLQSTAEQGQEGQEKLQTELGKLTSVNQDQAREIAQLKAELGTYRDADQNDTAISESKMAMKARIASLTKQNEEQTALIHSLRADLAANNDRMARQASHFMEELRRLGGGTVPTTGPARRKTALGSGETGNGNGGGYGTNGEGAKRPLSERIADPRPAGSAQSLERAAVARRAVQGVEQDDPKNIERASGFLRALGGFAPSAAANNADAQPAPGEAGVDVADADKPAVGKGDAQPAGKRRMGGLLDRITGLDRNGS